MKGRNRVSSLDEPKAGIIWEKLARRRRVSASPVPGASASSGKLGGQKTLRHSLAVS